MYALLPNKTGATYNELLLQVKNRQQNNNDSSSILKLLFLMQHKISFCRLKWKDISTIFVQTDGNTFKDDLQDGYNNEPEFALHLRMISALVWSCQNWQETEG